MIARAGLVFLVVLVSVLGSAGAQAASAGDTGFFAQLLRGETSFGDRWLESNGDVRTLTFYSEGLPAECRERALVSVIADQSESGRIVVQVMGVRPRVYTTACVLAALTDIRRADQEGMRLVVNNLNRMPSGAHLYIEFAVEGPQAGQLRERIRGILFGGEGNLLKGRGHAMLGAVIMIVFCMMGLVWGLRTILAEANRGDSNV